MCHFFFPKNAFVFLIKAFLFLSRFEVLPKSKTLKSTRNENFLLGINFYLLKYIILGGYVTLDG